MGLNDKRRMDNIANYELKDFESKKCGAFQVIRYVRNNRVKVRFYNTGYECYATLNAVKSGDIRDPMSRCFLGVGYLGVGEYKGSIKGVETEEYKCWARMLTRCYNEKYQERSPWYRGCSVCNEWHNFQVFAKWHKQNHPKDGGSYHLDKDILFSGNKVYRPEACSFVTAKENTQEAKCKRTISVVSSGGKIVKSNSAAAISRIIGVSESVLSRIINGKQESSKGWRLLSLSDKPE